MQAHAEDAACDIPDAMRLDRQVCFPLYAASNLITRLYRPLLVEHGLTYPQYLVMLALWERSPQSVGSLGELLHLDSGTLTPLLKRMEAAGLVARRRDRDDERRVHIQLTAKGEALRERIRHIPEQLAGCLSVAPAELAALRDVLHDVVAALEKDVRRR